MCLRHLFRCAHGTYLREAILPGWMRDPDLFYLQERLLLVCMRTLVFFGCPDCNMEYLYSLPI